MYHRDAAREPHGRPRSLRPAVAAAMCLVVLGCTEFGLDPVDEDKPPAWALVTDTFAQAPLPAVDLLFVIDDTASMAQEQQALATRFDALATLLQDAGVQWQAGVVSTDMVSDQPGWLHGAPWILTPELPDPEAAFAQSALVGTEGARPEAGFAAALEALALTAPGQPNAGFRRPDAALHVIFVSDADDQSDDWLGADAAQEFLFGLMSESVGGSLPKVSAVVGDLPRGCSSATGTARAAYRYHWVVDATGGAVVSICDLDLQPLLAELGEASLVYPTHFPLREQPVEGSLRVSVDSTRLDEGWSVESGPPILVFDTAPSPGARIEARYVVEVGL